MKHTIVFLVFISITARLFAQSDFYYTDKGEKETFKIRKDKVILKTRSADEAKALSKQSFFRSSYDAHDWIIATIDTMQIKLDGLKQRADIVDVAYALEYNSDAFYYPTGRIAVKFKEGQSIEKFLNTFDLSKNIESIELFDNYSKVYVITLNVDLGDILHISRKMFEMGLFVFAAPSFMWEIKPHNQHYSNQWALRNIGQSGGTSGIDIKAGQAWEITRGSIDIRVAVLDEGVVLNHPDLQNNLLPGFDAVPANWNPGGANGSPFGTNAHGTACAGVLAAIDNAIGIVGVASNVRIIPIRIAFIAAGANNWTTDDAWVANGINRA
jgi:subtilisin family serine protease